MVYINAIFLIYLEYDIQISKDFLHNLWKSIFK